MYSKGRVARKEEHTRGGEAAGREREVPSAIHFPNDLMFQ